MSKEFENLKALLCSSEPSNWEPQVDRGEAAKLAARWGWLVRRAREKRSQLFQTRPTVALPWGRGTPGQVNPKAAS
jgi:hypothetical protein